MNLGPALFRLKLCCRTASFFVIFAAFSGCGSSESDESATKQSGGAASDSIASSENIRMPKSASVFREHKVTDPGMNNIVAGTILVPDGWKIEGGMTRPGPKYYSTPFLLDVSFAAPDGRAVHFFPSLSFEFNYNQPAQPFAPTLNGNMYLNLPKSAGGWLMDMAKMQPDPDVSNVKLVSEKQEQEVTKLLRQNNAQTYQMIQQNQYLAAQTGVSMDFDTQATVVVIQYEENGIELEESILIAWQYFINLWQGQVTGGNWTISYMYSLRGPVGSDYMNDPQLAAISQSMKPNPVWEAEMNRYWAELSRIRAKGASDRNRQAWAANQKLSQTLSETSDIIANGWASRNATTDAGHSSYIDSIHEVTPYTTTGGSTVKLPSFYDHVYTDGNGTYILNNDSFYDPNTDSSVNSQNWSRVTPTNN